MKKINENRAITLIALIITVIVILILASISTTEGVGLIKKVKKENIITNMIMIKSKAKVFAEEVNAKVWNSANKSSDRERIFQEQYNMQKISNEPNIISQITTDINDSNGCECYQIQIETLHIMGLDDLANTSDNDEYIVVYNSEDFTKLEVLHKNDKGNYDTLTNLQEE